jgi:hypothetical protein
MRNLFHIVLAVVLLSKVGAFQPHLPVFSRSGERRAPLISNCNSHCQKQVAAGKLFAESKESLDSIPNEAPKTPTVTRDATREVKETSQPYPVDLPSPLLLSSAMILAIAGTGTLKDLWNCKAIFSSTDGCAHHFSRVVV